MTGKWADKNPLPLRVLPLEKVESLGITEWKNFNNGGIE